MWLKIEDKKYYVFDSISLSPPFFIARAPNDSIQDISCGELIYPIKDIQQSTYGSHAFSSVISGEINETRNGHRQFGRLIVNP